MFLYVLLILAISFSTLRLRDKVEKPLSHANTTIINGIFVLLIFLSHSTQYFDLPESLLDGLYRHFQNFCNQWVVVTFLAFSGYGVMRQIARGGGLYIHDYPVKRLFKTWLNFAVAIVLFLIADVCLGIQYDALTIILSFTGLTAVGNSNWYMFAILLMYLITYLCAVFAMRGDARGSGEADAYDDTIGKKIAGGVTIGAMIYFVAAQFFLPSRFSSTIMCYPFGIWLALYEDKIIGFLTKRKIVSIIVLAIILLVTYKLRYVDAIMEFASICFALAVVWFLCFFKFESMILKFIGTHAFSIFILQRIPFMVFQALVPGMLEMPMVFVAGSFLVTLVMSIAFDKAMKYVDDKMILRLLRS